MTTASTPPRGTALVLAVLGFLATIGPFSTDMYMPTMVGLAEDFAAPPWYAQLTLTGFLIGLGSGPLLIGPLSDRFGRRPVLLIALSAFVLLGLAMPFAPTLPVLIALRLLQGTAAAAGGVLSRAIASDLYSGAAAVRAISVIAVAIGVGALAAPPLGQTVGQWFGWQGAFVLLAGIGAAMLLLTAVFVPETHVVVKGTAQPSLARHIGDAITAPSVLALAVALAAGYAAMMAYISASPFISSALFGLTGWEYTVAFTLAATAMIISTMVNVIIAPRVGPWRMLAASQALLATGAGALVLFSATGILSAVSFFMIGFAMGAGVGLVLTNATALALAVPGVPRGSVSAVLSTVQYGMGALAAPLVGVAGQGNVTPLVIVVAVAATLSITFGRRARRRHMRR